MATKQRILYGSPSQVSSFFALPYAHMLHSNDRLQDYKTLIVYYTICKLYFTGVPRQCFTYNTKDVEKNQRLCNEYHSYNAYHLFKVMNFERISELQDFRNVVNIEIVDNVKVFIDHLVVFVSNFGFSFDCEFIEFDEFVKLKLIVN